MGCNSSKQQVFPGAAVPGSNYFKDSSRLLKHNIVMPLSEREVFSITKSWKTISRNIINTGIAMFLKMFESRSDVKTMFEQFRSVEKEDLYSSRSLENHALLVMNALDEAIANLDDPEYLVDMLLVTGKSHRRFEHFNAEIFWAIEEPFLVSVKNTLGSRFNAGTERIYQKTIRFVLDTLILGFEKDFAEDHRGSNGTTSFVTS